MSNTTDDSFLLPEIMGSPKLTKLVLLTVLIFILPTVQTIWLSALKFFHPVIKDIEMDKNDKVFRRCCRAVYRGVRKLFGVKVMTKENGHEWENTKLKYKDMCKMLKEEFEGRPCWKQVRDWLDIKEINVMQYKENDQTAGVRTIERLDGRMAKMRKCEEDDFKKVLDAVALRARGTNARRNNPTNMMIIINYHIRIMSTVEFFKQINYGMIVSPRTDPHRKGSMEWRGVIEEVSKLEPGLRFPDVLRYSVIRKLSDKINENWDHSKKGTELDPHSLLIDPWGPLETNAVSFINSFLWDVWIFWFQVWFGIVVIGILVG